MAQLIIDVKEIQAMIKDRIEADYGREVRGVSFEVINATEQNSSYVKTVCISFGDKTLRNKLTQ